MKHKAVFLDKDGELIPDLNSDKKFVKFDLNEQFVEGLQLLQSYGYLLVIVSNDAPEQVEKVKNTIDSRCKQMGIYLDGFYYCPHHQKWSLPDDSCDCMKPSPGLLLKAAGEMDIDLSASWMIGDDPEDVETGKRAGCNTVLVKHDKKHSRNGVKYKAKNLADAARQILYATGVISRKRRSRKVIAA